MRLLDQVVQAVEPVEIDDMTGRHRLPGCVERADALHACPLRWVLQPNVAQRCRDLLRTDRAMLVGENMLLRAPAPHFWIEWMDWGAGRTGLLVEASDDGRRGSVEVFWEQSGREPDYAQARLAFDFDATICQQANAAVGRFAIEADQHPLSAHLLIDILPEWVPHLSAAGVLAGRQALRHIAASVVASAEMLFAFSAIMLDRPEIDNKPADLGRLNRNRVARGKPALLDHLEVTFNLDGHAASGQRGGSERSGSRLHYVRGHMVRREGKAFWRRSHLRGDPGRPVRSRTVTVR